MAANLAAQISQSADLRTVAVTVWDGAGQPVTDLSLKEFAVTEDGKPQQVRVCAYQDFTQAPPAERAGAQAAALEFAETRMDSQDLVAVLALRGEGLAILSDFTDDRTALAAALQRLSDDPLPLCESTGAADAFAVPAPRFPSLEYQTSLLLEQGDYTLRVATRTPAAFPGTYQTDFSVAAAPPR